MLRMILWPNPYPFGIMHEDNGAGTQKIIPRILPAVQKHAMHTHVHTVTSRDLPHW